MPRWTAASAAGCLHARLPARSRALACIRRHGVERIMERVEAQPPPGSQPVRAVGVHPTPAVAPAARTGGLCYCPSRPGRPPVVGFNPRAMEPTWCISFCGSRKRRQPSRAGPWAAAAAVECYRRDSWAGRRAIFPTHFRSRRGGARRGFTIVCTYGIPMDNCMTLPAHLSAAGLAGFAEASLDNQPPVQHPLRRSARRARLESGGSPASDSMGPRPHVIAWLHGRRDPRPRAAVDTPH